MSEDEWAAGYDTPSGWPHWDVDEAYREWGVPEDLIPFTSNVQVTNVQGHLPPQLWLPAGWTPEGWKPESYRPDVEGLSLEVMLPDAFDPSTVPTLDRVRQAVDGGMGLVVSHVAAFDFRWLGDAIAHLTSLHCGLSDDQLSGLDVLAGAISLRYLDAGADQVVDLSMLEALEEVLLRGGTGLLSAARAPRVRQLSVWLDGRPGGLLADLALSPSLRHLMIPCGGLDLGPLLVQVPDLESLHIEEAKNVDLVSLRHVPQLKSFSTSGVKTVDLVPLRYTPRLGRLAVTGAGTIDLAPVEGLRDLSHLSLYMIRAVTGAGALRRCPSLRTIDIFRVGEIEDRDSLLDLELDSFEGRGRAFDEEFEKAAEQKSGSWYVEYPKRRTPRE